MMISNLSELYKCITIDIYNKIITVDMREMTTTTGILRRAILNMWEELSKFEVEINIDRNEFPIDYYDNFRIDMIEGWNLILTSGKLVIPKKDIVIFNNGEGRYIIS